MRSGCNALHSLHAAKVLSFRSDLMLFKIPPRFRRYLKFLAGGAVGYLAAIGFFAVLSGEQSGKLSFIVTWTVVGALMCWLTDPRVPRHLRD